jgi:hypothetical protein
MCCIRLDSHKFTLDIFLCVCLNEKGFVSMRLIYAAPGSDHPGSGQPPESGATPGWVTAGSWPPVWDSPVSVGRRSGILLFLVCRRDLGHSWVGLGVVIHVPLPDALAFPDRSLTALEPSRTTAVPSEA